MLNKNKGLWIIAVMLLFSGATGAWLNAQEVNDEAREKAMMAINEELNWLQEEAAVMFVVTASRVKEDIRKSASSITVITAEQIRNMGARNLVDALRTVPGVSFRYRSDGHYKFDIRGISKNGGQDVLVMINSHPINENYTGGATWTHDTMTVDNIKRIEVIRGPGSAMYGANAFSGVVNIITKDPLDIDGVQFTAGGGSYRTQQYNLMTGKEWGDFGAVLNFNYFKTRGFEAFIEEDAQTANDKLIAPFIRNYQPASLAPGFAQGDDEKYDFFTTLKYKWLKFDGRYVERERTPATNVLSQLNAGSPDFLTDYYLNLKYENNFGDKLTVAAKAYRNYNQYEAQMEAPKGMGLLRYEPASPLGFAPFAMSDGLQAELSSKNTRTGAELQLTYRLADNNTLVGGVTYERLKQSDIEYAANFLYTNVQNVVIPFSELTALPQEQTHIKEADRTFQALFIQDMWDITDKFKLTVGARYDHYDDFGESFNPRAGIVWEYFKGFDIKLLYGRAFRAPTFQELYMQNNPSQTGNENLEPETVDTFEISLGASLKALSARITGFRSSIQDSITSIRSEEGLYVFENAEELRTNGVELELKYDFAKAIWAGMNYTYQHAKDVDTGNRVHLRPRQKGNIMANVELSRFANLYADYYFLHDFIRQPADTRDTPDDYGVMNTSLILKNFPKPFKGIELRGSVYNLLDERYTYPTTRNTLPGDLPMPGRSYFVELRLTI